jgi:hypothetical protein
MDPFFSRLIISRSSIAITILILELNSTGDYVYKIGKRFQETFRKRNRKRTIFNSDRGQVIDRGTRRQTYGFYPFYF